jgi:hypothetical protein
MKFRVVAETSSLLQQYVSLQLVGLLLLFEENNTQLACYCHDKVRLQTITHLSTNCVLHFPMREFVKFLP